jgi:hypothetical protein
MNARRLQDEIVSLRHRVQTCESRTRLAQQALDALRQRLMAASMTLPIVDMAEVLEQMTRIENLLSDGEVSR